MEQMSFDMEISDERKAFDLLYPELADLFYNAPKESEILVFKEINNCSSVYFLNPGLLCFQIRLRKKTKYLLLPEEFEGELPDGTTVTRAKSDAGMIRIALDVPEDVLKYIPILRTILTRLQYQYSTFACCSRYEACSDARSCIHPDVKFALGCQYRRNLMEGKIFYGKNRNIT